MSLYKVRFSEKDFIQKEKVWKVLCKNYFQRFIRKEDRVLDLAGGYCEFINNIECAEKYAIDIDSESLKRADSDAHAIRSSCTDLSIFPSDFFDLLFASNIFEHFRSKGELESILRQVRRVLKPNGRILVLGPNIRYCYREYWDFFDHQLPFSHVSMCGVFMKNGFILKSMFLNSFPRQQNRHRQKSPCSFDCIWRFRRMESFWLANAYLRKGSLQGPNKNRLKTVRNNFVIELGCLDGRLNLYHYPPRKSGIYLSSLKEVEGNA